MRDRRSRLIKRSLLGILIAVVGWKVYGLFQSVTKASAKEKPPAKIAEIKPAGNDDAVEKNADDGATTFGMVPLAGVDPPKERAQMTVAELVARGHKVDGLMEKAEQAKDAGHQLVERAFLNQALALMDEGVPAANVRSRLSAMNTSVFLGRDVLIGDPYALMVPIQAGDSFQKIARRFGISSELVTLINPEVNPRRLRVDSGIKVIQGPFNVRIVRADGRLDLYARDLYVRSYAVHLEDGSFLPAGMYKVKPSGKVVTKNAAGQILQRIEIAGIESQTDQVRVATLYSSPNMRTPAGGGAVAGMRLEEADFSQLFAAVVEEATWVRVEE